MRTIDLNFRYSKQQIIKAYRFHYSAVLHPKRDMMISLILLAVGLFFNIRLGFSYLWIGVMALAILLLGILGFAFYLLPAMVYAQSDKLKEEYYLTLKDEGMTFKTKGIDSEINWSLYNKMRENADFILLYYGKNAFTIIPKAVFKSQDDLATLMELSRSKIGRK